MDIQDALNDISKRLNVLEARRQQERVVTLDLPNGEKITAPTGIWFLAFTTVMDSEMRTKLIDALMNIQKDHLAHNITFNPITTPLEELIKSSTPANPTGQIAHTDFVVDSDGKKHYTMHCDPGNYAGSFKSTSKLTHKPISEPMLKKEGGK